MRMIRRIATVLAALALLPAGLAAQTTGTVTGRVVDASTQAPLSDVQVFAVGTARGALTGQDGTYRIQDVPVGPQQVRATRIGYTEAAQAVTVGAGEVATANFTLTQSAIELGAVIVTATGQRQALREVGNAVGTINVAQDVPAAAVNSVSQVLQGRVAGVSVVQSSGTTGTGARIRIRGSNSVSLSNDPLVIVDGIRVDNASNFSIDVGGQTTTRLNDINPQDIESMEILKGPAASALYGTAAANGVIVIRTKRGQEGTTRFRAFAEYTQLKDVTDYPANYRGVDPDAPVAGTRNRCLTIYQALGYCTLDELLSFNPLMDSKTSPFQTGGRQNYGLSVSGGGEQNTYYLSGEFQTENGVYSISDLNRVNLRGNFTSQITDNLDVQLSTGYLNSDARLPQNDNNILGIVSGGLLGSYQYSDSRCGYYLLCPASVFAIDTRQNVDRFTGSATANWRPIPWLSVVGTAGIDDVNRSDHETVPPGRVPFSTYIEGERTANRIRVQNYTTNLSATADYPIRGDNLTGSTSVGTSYTEDIFRGNYAYGSGLLRGTGSLNGVATRLAVGETNTHSRTVGMYLQQQLNFNQRLYLTGAIRADDNSAFGTDFGLIAYPSVSASWVVADEPWFPQTDVLTNLRLRAAYGRSGLQPGFRDAVRYFSPTVVTLQGASIPTFQFGGAGNRNLKPERSGEFEVGFDAGVLGDRLGVELTYYNKTSEDALIARRIAPSVGISSTRYENLGKVKNSGVETSVNARLVDLPRFQWNATLTGSWNRNELVELGAGISPIIFGLGGNTQRHTPGYPLGAYFQRTISYDDANGDGLLTPDEVALSDTAVYLGSPFPKREVSLSTSLDLFRYLRLEGMLDYQGGFKQFNSTREFRCAAILNCREAYDPTASLADQAAILADAGFLDAGTSAAGFIEDGDFVKLREVTLTLTAPDHLARRVGVNGLSLSLSGRNLKTWTDYRGFDPESNFAGSGSNFSTADFLTQPPLRTFTARIDVQF